MHEITVPKLNSNDAGYVLTGWHFADGDTVPAGAEIAVVETSKAAEELIADAGGILQRRVEEKQECRPGEVIARLFPDEPARQRFLATTAGTGPADDAPALIITEPAQELIDRHGVDPAALRALGKTLIGTKDVQKLLEESGRNEHRLSAQQLAVAEVVTESHRTIPAAYAVVAVTVDEALATGVRLPELLIHCVTGLFEKYPLFFAAARDDGTARLADEPRVGVTVDVGHGLTIPVLRGPDLESPATIGRAMTSFRGKALRQRFTASDLTGATIAVSMPAGDVLVAQPIVPPGLSCMLALGATHQAPGFDAAGGLVRRQVAYLGLSYDHRLINGRDAALFLGELKGALESTDRLRELLGGIA